VFTVRFAKIMLFNSDFSFSVISINDINCFIDLHYHIISCLLCKILGGINVLYLTELHKITKRKKKKKTGNHETTKS